MEMKLTPVAATWGRRSLVMEPEASKRARPRVISTAWRQGGVVHIVQQDEVGAGVQGLFQSLQVRHFHFDLEQVVGPGFGLPHRLADGTHRGQVIVLDEHPVVEPQAVVAAAAQAHRVFLQGPPAGGGFPGVHQGGSGPGHLVHHAG